MERGTFQDSAAKLFNVLLANIRNCSDFKVYCREFLTGEEPLGLHTVNKP
ncbi:unnamed protein product, partial [Porites evermanni]